MLIIGITGGIGSGKSVVCKVFEQLFIPVYYADDESKKLITTNAELIAEITKNFGENIYTKQGEIDRKRLSSIVFTDEKALQKLNAITHPAVKKHFLAWVKKQKSVPFILKEAAILFESEANKDCDFVLTVYAPQEIRIKRVMERDGVSRESVEARMSKQMSDEKKIKLSDFVIYNDEKQLVVPQVLKLYDFFYDRKT